MSFSGLDRLAGISPSFQRSCRTRVGGVSASRGGGAVRGRRFRRTGQIHLARDVISETDDFVISGVVVQGRQRRSQKQDSAAVICELVRSAARTEYHRFWTGQI